MATRNIQRQLTTVIAVSAAITLVSAAVLYGTLQQSLGSSRAIAATLSEKLTSSYVMLETVNDARSDVQRLLRLRDPDELEAAVGRLEQSHKQAADLLTRAGNAAADVKAAVLAVDETEQRITEAVLKGDMASASDTFISKASAQYERVEETIGAYAATAKVAAERQQTDSEAAIRTAIWWRLGLVGLVLAASTAFQWRVKAGLGRRLVSVTTSLWQTSTGLTSAAGQVASTSQSVSQGTTEQAASLEETSAALEEMASMTRNATESAGHAKALAAEAKVAAERGAVDMQALGAAVDEIRGASDNIAKIIKTINDIAFQTNILALNAAVEAARAGDSGLGFAVVASEVRSLAQRSAQAARDTSARIEESIAKSQKGIEIRDKVVVGLQVIVDKARQVDELMGTLATSSLQQRQGIEQVSTAVVQMEKVTQAGAASAEQGAAAAHELSGMARDAQSIVEQLQQIVGGRLTRSAGPAQAGAAEDAGTPSLRAA
jgi:methyl-accepting chemotaxis protein